MNFSLLFLFALTGLTAAQPTTKRAGSCSKYTIIDTRGTGEAQGESSGFRTMNRNVLAKLSGGDQYHTVYPADFSQNSASGTQDIVNKVQQLVGQDSSHCIVLEGYSQGAAATVNAMSRLTGANFDAVKAVFLIGDPLHKPNLACNVDPNGGKTTASATGISAASSQGIPSSWVAKTLDVCVTGDGVCSRETGSGITYQHLSYPNSAPTQSLGTNFIEKMLSA